MSLDDLYSTDIYGYESYPKRAIHLTFLKERLILHYEECATYKAILNGLGVTPEIISGAAEVGDLPYIPVTLFKELELRSISKNEIFKITTSSGTSGQQVSKIYLDKENARVQSKVLTTIVSKEIGKRRLPMIILDSESVVKDRRSFSARAAGVIGFSMFGREIFYALNEEMELKFEDLLEFLSRNGEGDILIYGFTFIIWIHFIQYLIDHDLNIDLRRCILIHGGGFKKLAANNITYTSFKELLQEKAGIFRVHDYYGMVEQTGSIMMECEAGYLHTNIFNDVLIRSTDDFSILGEGKVGLIQMCSLLPSSYPGNLILTEDLGVLLGEDNCSCGRRGKFIKVLGRVKSAEVRGCSDTYEKR